MHLLFVLNCMHDILMIFICPSPNRLSHYVFLVLFELHYAILSPSHNLDFLCLFLILVLFSNYYYFVISFYLSLLILSLFSIITIFLSLPTNKTKQNKNGKQTQPFIYDFLIKDVYVVIAFRLFVKLN